ncbi:PucR family transcriptional regulator [Yinghuangia soli]|uniref:Helix-turn-helix domain-containing protein n=1 Tax=Yinghuangia soli TaxID=2908204 RepID=A0AA41U125_9ACTN|nr:helix-turn-helix domain-containing protein [Yinghuangia soli]MCF2525704.1 helix-turn-helix domain-containing protein [Yinghuangia soli]
MTIAAAVEVLGDGPVDWGIQLALPMAAEIIRQVPEHGGGAAPFDTLRRATESSVLAALSGIRRDVMATSDSIPAEALEGNREFVRRSIPLDRVLRGVRLGHAALHRALMEVIGDDPDEARRVGELLFAYVDVHSSTLADDYTAELDRWAGSTAAQRRRMVEDIVAGRSVEAEPAGRILGYDVRSRHTALILSATDPRVASQQVLLRYAAELAYESCSLIVPVAESAVWIWLAGTPNRNSQAPAGVRVACGPPTSGVDGFRRSHMGARAAERIAASSTGSAAWCDHADIHVAALCTADPEQAQWFVQETLGALAADDDRTAELRLTLRSYLAAGRSLRAAADDLHIARNTVTYRVKQAEELLGRPLATARLEIQLALEIAHWLPSGRQVRHQPPLESTYFRPSD